MKFYLFLLIIFSTSCYSLNPSGEGTKVHRNEFFNTFLKNNVDLEGLIDYRSAVKDSGSLALYIKELGQNPPSENWPKEDALAYWINLYNAATISLVLRHYPISSLKDIGSSFQIPFVNTPWQLEFIKIGDNYYDLDNIEHNIIRKNFSEPRIHFALVCGALSCPKLRNEAYTGENLHEQLEDQARIFLNNPKKNRIGDNKAELSKIFFWFKSDFTNEVGLKDYVNKYLERPIPNDVNIEYSDYNWALNEKSK